MEDDETLAAGVVEDGAGDVPLLAGGAVKCTPRSVILRYSFSISSVANVVTGIPAS